MKQLLLVLLVVLSCRGTLPAQKNIRGLLNAERKFAAFTATHSVKEGFLKFMDSAGILFRQGVDLNALDFYKRQPVAPGILTWEPDFAVISASGDMGATSGPYEFRSRSVADTVSGRGSFFSVWRINSQGDWKNLADLGTVYTKTAPEQPLKQVVLSRLYSAQNVMEDLLLLDRKFNKAVQDRNIGAWMPYISSDSRFNIDGQWPAVGMLQIADAMQKLPSGLLLATKTGEMSAAFDFAYTYGIVANGNRKENYLRVWTYRNGQWYVLAQAIKL